MFTDKLKQAILNEYADYHFYRSMYKLTDDPYWQGFIEHVYEDEKSHYEMFQQLYYMLTGTFVQNFPEPKLCLNLKECAKSAIRDELEAAEMYKEMLLQIPIQQAYAPLFVAMHDETEHAIRFSTMYNAL
ncbi:ferritin-like domain-containing protein [Bacillus sp. FJAT-22090]|uniref:ferritin-like domain-containing protein n=1 Tax=Bacillus sp. FJAT-22090 TaxID=1581038 RepID=UPI0011A998DE|nr:ferritin-like domain-containing protein [Bacillus sp. FJAT-22090]